MRRIVARAFALVAVALLMAGTKHPDLGFARGLEMAREADVRLAVAAYAATLAPHPEFYFNEEAAVRAILFYPTWCRLTKGAHAGRPFVLQPWQAFEIVAPVFGWRAADGTRRYRRVSIWLPRKNGKTELMAGTALQHLLADGEMGGEGYCVATKEEQAREVFEAARRMVLLNEGLKRNVQPYSDSLWCEQLFAAFKVLGGKSDGTHGKGPSFRIADELHEFKDDRLLQFLDQGMSARLQPISWDISTAGLQQGYGWELWNTCRQIAEGVLVDDRALVVIYAADEDDDPWDPATWFKANPNLGVSIPLVNMHDESRVARQNARKTNDFLRYKLNRWIGQLVRWLKIERWDACTAGKSKDAWRNAQRELIGRKCFIGVDLASTKDICAEVLVFPPANGDTWRVLCRFWLPGADLEERIRSERVPYDLWSTDGAIFVTDGDAADHDAIKAQILEDLQMFDVQGLGFDPWNAHKLMVEINEIYPDLAMKVAQNMATLSGPSKYLERLVLKGELDHGNHPVLRWMADNVATVTDTNGNIKPAKNKSTQKIDGIVALIIALALTLGASGDNLPSMEVVTL